MLSLNPPPACWFCKKKCLWFQWIYQFKSSALFSVMSPTEGGGTSANIPSSASSTSITGRGWVQWSYYEDNDHIFYNHWQRVSTTIIIITNFLSSVAEVVCNNYMLMMLVTIIWRSKQQGEGDEVVEAAQTPPRQDRRWERTLAQGFLERSSCALGLN